PVEREGRAMTAREVLLLRFLGVVLGGALLVLGITWYGSSMSRLGQDMTLNDQRLTQLHERQTELKLNPDAVGSKRTEVDKLTTQAELLSGRFVSPGPIDVYAFSDHMRMLARQAGLSVEQMQIDDLKKRLSLQVSGTLERSLWMLSAIEKEDNF